MLNENIYFHISDVQESPSLSSEETKKVIENGGCRATRGADALLMFKMRYQSDRGKWRAAEVMVTDSGFECDMKGAWTNA